MLKMLRRKRTTPSLEEVSKYDVALKRKFLGKWYKWVGSYSQKEDANDEKARLKKQGKLVRMVKVKRIHVLYVRNK